MTVPPATARLARPTQRDRRMDAAWTRLIVGALAVAVPVALVLGSVGASRAEGAATVRTTLGTLSSALRAEHDVDGAWPADLMVVGGVVLDDGGHRIASIPDGVAVAYERSLDGGRAVLTLSDRGARAVFDTADPAT